MCVSVKIAKMKEAEPTTEIEINRINEPQFREYAAKRVREEPEGPLLQDVIDGGAEVLDLSPRTTERYLRKLCSSEGQYEKVRTDTGYVIKKKQKKRP